MSEKHNLICKQYREGQTSASLASEFGLSWGYVRKIVGARLTPVPPPTAERNDLIRRAYASGQKAGDLATEHGVSVVRIYQLVRGVRKGPPKFVPTSNLTNV